MRLQINFFSRTHFYMSCLMGIGLCFLHCTSDVKSKSDPTQINSAHLDALYEEVPVENDTVGIIHIYAEYPDYQWLGDEDEGIACVDDASRAAVFYLRQFALTHEPAHLHKARMLLKFLLAMQAPNGYYYNFIWPDRQIHKDGITTVAEPNWWSWRTLWTFGEALKVLDKKDVLIQSIIDQRYKLVRALLNEESFKFATTDTTMGVYHPTWLPGQSGADQAAVAIIGLTLMLQQSGDDIIHRDSIKSCIRRFAEGILLMQMEEPGSLYDGAFLSWENIWHAYGNVQSYALLMAGRELDDPHYIAHALYEIDHFYPSFLAAGGWDHFFIRVADGKTSMYNEKVFSQIAYGRRPMIWAAVLAYEITSEEKYATLAKSLSAWFTGDNPAHIPMYDPVTGRGYDGIISADSINKNAGAESTIEALLSLQSLERLAPHQ